MAWQRFRVAFGGAGPVEVQSSARDWAAVPFDPNSPRGLDMTFRVVHAACKRLNIAGTPRKYEDFLDALDGIPESLDEEDPDEVDPTDAAPSAASP